MNMKEFDSKSAKQAPLQSTPPTNDAESRTEERTHKKKTQNILIRYHPTSRKIQRRHHETRWWNFIRKATIMDAMNAANIVPTENDIIFGSRGNRFNPATKRFREIMEEHLEKYRNTHGHERQKLEITIIDQVKKELPSDARFLRLLDAQKRFYQLMTENEAQFALNKCFLSMHDIKMKQQRKADILKAATMNATNIVPTKNDIIFGIRGGRGPKNAAYKRFREFLKDNLQAHTNANHHERRDLETNIMKQVKKLSPDARFIQLFPFPASGPSTKKVYGLMSDKEVRKSIVAMFAVLRRQKARAKETTSLSQDVDEEVIWTQTKPPAATFAHTSLAKQTNTNTAMRPSETTNAASQGQAHTASPVVPTAIVPTDDDVIFAETTSVVEYTATTNLLRKILAARIETFRTSTLPEKRRLEQEIQRNISQLPSLGRFLRFTPTNGSEKESFSLMTDDETVQAIAETLYSIDSNQRGKDFHALCETHQGVRVIVVSNKADAASDLISLEPSQTSNPPEDSANRLGHEIGNGKTNGSVVEEQHDPTDADASDLVSLEPSHTSNPSEDSANRLAHEIGNVETNGSVVEEQHDPTDALNLQQLLDESNNNAFTMPANRSDENGGLRSCAFTSSKRPAETINADSRKRACVSVADPSAKPSEIQTAMIKDGLMTHEPAESLVISTNSSAQTNASLKEEIQQLREQNEQLEEEMEQMKMNHAMEIGAMEGGTIEDGDLLEEEVSNLKADLERAQQQIQQLQAVREASSLVNEEIVATLRETNRDLSTTNERLEESNEKMKRRIAALEHLLAEQMLKQSGVDHP